MLTRHVGAQIVAVLLLLLLLLLLTRGASSARALGIGRGLATVRTTGARSAQILVGELMDETIGAIVVALGRTIGGLRGLHALILRRVALSVHEVAGTSVGVVRLLGAPDLLLTILVRVDGLGEGGRRGGICTALLRGKVPVVIIVETEVQVQAVLLVVLHGGRREGSVSAALDILDKPGGCKLLSVARGGGSAGSRTPTWVKKMYA